MATESSSDSDPNLQILRRLDPEVDEVLATAGHVCLYYMHVTSQQWTRKNVEGSLFLLKRRKAPRFQMMVLNKLATENYIETIHGSFDFEVNAPYLMYTHGNSEIHGIWFYEQEDLNRLFGLLNRIKSGLPKTDVLPTTAAPGAEQPAPAADAFWDKQVEVSASQVPLKPDMQPAPEPAQPATQSLTNLLKQAHLKQQQSQQQSQSQQLQQQQGDMAPQLLAPSFFQAQTQQAAPPVTAGLASKQPPNPKQEAHVAHLSQSGPGAFTSPPVQQGAENMLHKLFSKPAIVPGTQPPASQPPLTISQQSVIATAAVPATQQPTKQQAQPVQSSQPNALAKLFNTAGGGAGRVSNTTPVTRQQPGRSQEAVREKVRAAFAQLLADDKFVDLISEQFKAVGLIAE